MSACGFDNHLRRQLADRQEQQTKEMQTHPLAEESLICHADESAPHLDGCCASSVYEYQKKGAMSVNFLERKNMYSCVYVLVSLSLR